MANKSLTVVRPGTYGTRALVAGDPFDATGPEARLYLKLGWMTEGKPKAAAKPETVNAVAPAPAQPKAPRKKKAPAKKTA